MTVGASKGIAAAAADGGLPYQSLEFDGSSDYLSMSDANYGAYDREKFGVAFSVKPDNVTTGAFIMAHELGIADRSWRIEVNNGALEIRCSPGGTFDISSIITVGSWQSFLLYYDSANPTAGDRMRLWKDGVEQTASSYTAPTVAVNDISVDVTIGARSGGVGKFNGLIFQPTFFSGALPEPSDVFDGTAGKLKNLVGLAGAKSLIGAESDVTTDSILAASWTNNGSVTINSEVPE